MNEEQQKLNNKKWEKHLEISNKYRSQADQELGIIWGIPQCCIKQYIEDSNLGIMSAIHRMYVHKKQFNTINYVPCDTCAEKL